MPKAKQETASLLHGNRDCPSPYSLVSGEQHPHHHQPSTTQCALIMFHQGYRGRYSQQPRILFLATELAAGQGQGGHVSKLDRERGAPSHLLWGGTPDEGFRSLANQGTVSAPWEMGSVFSGECVGIRTITVSVVTSARSERARRGMRVAQ